MKAAPRLEHLKGNLLGLSAKAESLLVQPEPWHGKALYLPRRLEDFFESTAQNTAGFKFIGDALDPEERRILVDRLESAVEPFTPHVRVLDAIGAAREAKATFVVTRVSPRLIGPTIEDLLGVLHTIRLAAELTGYEKLPVLPLVWVRDDLPASAEACDAKHLGPSHQLLSLSCGTPLQELPRATVSTFTPDPTRLPLLRAQLRQWIESSDHRDEAISLLLPEPGETLSRRLRATLYRMFGEEGLIVCGPTDFREDLGHELSEVVDRGRNLLAAKLPEDEEICFDTQYGQELHRGGDGYRRTGEPGSRTGTELAAEIVQEPGRFHPSPQLEALLVRRFLPVRAWIGDRAEIEQEHRLVGLQDPERGRQAWVPRWQGTWLYPRDEEALDRLSRPLSDALQNSNGNYIEDTESISAHVQQQLASPRASLTTLISEFRASARHLVEQDATLKPLLRRQSRQAEAVLKTFIERAERALRNRGGTEALQHRRLMNALRPEGRHASSVYGPLLPLARYGPEAFRELREEIETFTFEHIAIFTR